MRHCHTAPKNSSKPFLPHARGQYYLKGELRKEDRIRDDFRDWTDQSGLFFGSPWATTLFFDLKKVNAPAQVSQIEQRPARDLPGSTLTGNSLCFRMGSIPRRMIKQLKHKTKSATKIYKKRQKKQKASKGDVFLKAKVAAQYWQLWTSQEQGGRNESGGISAYHNIYATKKWTHAHMAASPICFVSNSWQFARKWCSQLLNGRIWVGWQFQIN